MIIRKKNVYSASEIYIKMANMSLLTAFKKWVLKKMWKNQISLWKDQSLPLDSVIQFCITRIWEEQNLSLVS